MTIKRSKEPWMPAEDFGRSLPRGSGPPGALNREAFVVDEGGLDLGI